MASLCVCFPRGKDNMVTFANFDSVLRKNEITIRKLDVSAFVFFYSVVSKNVELRLKKSVRSYHTLSELSYDTHI